MVNAYLLAALAFVAAMLVFIFKMIPRFQCGL